MNAAPDAELLHAVRQGDSRALATLLERHAPSVYRFGLKLCGDPQDAQDVVQETLLAATRSLQNFRGDASISTWLYTVARNACRKRSRGSKGAPATVEPLSEDVPQASGEPGPDEALERRALARALDAELAHLSPTEREVLVLRDVEGLSASEVAEIVGISVQAVKSRLHRARAALRARMEPYFPEAERPSGLGAQPACPEIVSVFSRYLEDEIGTEECDAMKSHVAACKRCDAACKSLRHSLALCRATPVAPVPPAVQASIKRALGRLLG